MSRLPRSFYIPSNALLMPSIDATLGEVYIYTNAQGKLCAKAFRGKADKPQWNYSFKDADNRALEIARTVESWTANARVKTERSATRKAFQHTLKVGDLLVSSWGYEQTNIDYYQVVSVTGKSVSVQPIGRFETRAGGSMDGYCKPAPGQYTGNPRTHRVLQGNSIKITSFSSAHLCKATDEHHWSSWH